MSIEFIVYLVLAVLFWTSPMAILAFQPEIRKQTNLWRVFNIPYRLNLLAAFQFVMMLMLEVVGMSFIAVLITITPK